ncbi:MAG: hypothetical protein WAU01_16110 [Saprospiraceae bacterium]
MGKVFFSHRWPQKEVSIFFLADGSDDTEGVMFFFSQIAQIAQMAREGVKVFIFSQMAQIAQMAREGVMFFFSQMAQIAQMAREGVKVFFSRRLHRLHRWLEKELRFLFSCGWHRLHRRSYVFFLADCTDCTDG